MKIVYKYKLSNRPVGQFINNFPQIHTYHKKEVDFTDFLLKVLKSFTEFQSCEEQRNEFADTML